ncbi:CDP-glycerol glycerophosphotransferase family protein, partial [Candidatus Sumerlaeota bacterium]|nr:CDP-glycerol glycerophosphotransferase family protein [Candidatus Sumerlaeota bacterium]
YLLSRRSRVSVHTFHGISIKGQAFSEKALAFDRLFLIGPYQRRRFAELGVLGEDDPRFANIGMPKLDAFFDGSLVRENYLARHRLDPAKPTILYAPTWRPEASLYSVGEALIRTMREMPWNFMVKLHDLSLDTATNRIDWRQKMRELAAPNIAFIEELDATAALHAADLLISDASSVANEFTLLDRPLVFVEVPDLFKKYGKTIDLENWGQSSGAVARTVPEILERAKQALANPDEFAAPRRRIASEGFYNPGRATQAALDEIYRLIDLDPPAGN